MSTDSTLKVLPQTLNPTTQTTPSSDLSSYFDGIIGQDRAKKLILKSAESSISRSTLMPHVLFSGPPGTGKTVMALRLAGMIDHKMLQLDASVIRNPRDLAYRLQNEIRDGTKLLLFIDEIHALNSKTQETVYRLMDGEGISYSFRQSIITIDCKPIVVGATTNPGLLSEPLRDRIGLDVKLEPYTLEQIVEIVIEYYNTKGIVGVRTISHQIALRSRGVPRLAKRLTDRLYEWTAIGFSLEQQMDAFHEVCDLLGIDSLGLRQEDRDYLQALVQADGKPMGLRVLQSKLHADSNTIEYIIEPYLSRLEFIEQLSNGRIITSKGLHHLAKWEAEQK